VTAAIGIKRAGIALGAILAVAAGGLLLLSVLMPADTVREAVKSEIRAVTGLDPVLRGHASVSLFPAGKVSFEDVSLSDNRTGNPALTAERVVARLRFFPLLVGRIEIAEVLLQRPTINIVFNADRSSNWSGHIETLARNLRTERRQSTSFSEIRIESGTIVLRDQSHKIVETLSNVELSLAWPSISKSFAATGRFSWHNETIDTTISFADFAAALRGDRSGLKVRLAGAPLKFGFDGYLSHRPTVKIEGAVAADTSSLRETFRWTGAPPPPGGGFGRFALKAQVNVAGSTIGLSGVHIELDGNAGEGVLTLATDGRRTLQGTLATELLDLSPYISTVRLMASGDRGWDRKPLAVEGFSGIDIDLRLSAARVTVSTMKLGRTAVAANLRGSHLSIAVGESEAFGGMVKGTFGFARTASGADLKAQMQFANIDLDQSLGEMFGFRRLEGKGNLSFAIDSSGDSVYELTRGLNGTANLVSRKGAISGINVEQLLKRMERSPLSRGNELRTGKTPYDTLSASLKITRGNATVEDIRVEGPTVRLGMVGSASIPDRDLDLRGTASLVSTTPPAFELPFMVQGAWDDPVMLPDAQSLIQRSGAAQPLLDALRKSTARDAVRSAIERFGIGVPAAPPARPQPETAAKPATAEYAPAATESLPAAEPKAELKAGETPAPVQ
jgi:AsmA protein